jgi:hypothetical protein
MNIELSVRRFKEPLPKVSCFTGLLGTPGIRLIYLSEKSGGKTKFHFGHGQSP